MKYPSLIYGVLASIFGCFNQDSIQQIENKERTIAQLMQPEEDPIADGFYFIGNIPYNSGFLNLSRYQKTDRQWGWFNVIVYDSAGKMVSEFKDYWPPGLDVLQKDTIYCRGVNGLDLSENRLTNENKESKNRNLLDILTSAEKELIQ